MTEKKFHCILFDMDGTLIDSIPVIMESFQRAVKKVYGHIESDEDILKNSVGLPLKESFAHYPAADQPTLQKEYIRINDELQKNGVPMFGNMHKTLEALKTRGTRLAVVTSKREDPTIRLINVMKLAPLFEAVVGKERTQRHKPFGDPIIKCMDMMHIPDKSDVLYVGDSIHDVRCARDAGVAVAIVNWTRMDKSLLRAEKPEYWLDFPEDLLNFV